MQPKWLSPIGRCKKKRDDSPEEDLTKCSYKWDI
jgi:hypothetical protein